MEAPKLGYISQMCRVAFFTTSPSEFLESICWSGFGFEMKKNPTLTKGMHEPFTIKSSFFGGSQFFLLFFGFTSLFNQFSILHRPSFWHSFLPSMDQWIDPEVLQLRVFETAHLLGRQVLQP